MPTQTKPTAAEAAWTMSIPEAGKKYLGLGKMAAYQAADAGLIPTIKIGRFKKVLVRQLEKRLAGEAA
jgi:hypothetical protein